MASTDSGESTDALLIAALARGATQARAAQESGYSERTVRRRLKDGRFRGRVQAARRDVLERATGALAAGAMGVVMTLLKVASSAESESARLAAAKALMDQLPLRQMLGELRDGPETPRIEIIMPDYRRELRETLERGDLLRVNGPDAKKTDDGNAQGDKSGREPNVERP